MVAACERSERQGKGAIVAVVDEERSLEKVSTNQSHYWQSGLVRSKVDAHPAVNVDVALQHGAKEMPCEDGNFMIWMSDGRQSGRIDHGPASSFRRLRVHTGLTSARVDDCSPLLGLRTLGAIRWHQDHIYERPHVHQDGPR